MCIFDFKTILIYFLLALPVLCSQTPPSDVKSLWSCDYFNYFICFLAHSLEPFYHEIVVESLQEQNISK